MKAPTEIPFPLPQIPHSFSYTEDPGCFAALHCQLIPPITGITSTRVRVASHPAVKPLLGFKSQGFDVTTRSFCMTVEPTFIEL